MKANCRHCGGEIEEQGGFCPECRLLAGEKNKPRRVWIFSILFSTVLLFLTGLMVGHGGFGDWNFSLAALWGKPAAVINGETISRNEFEARMKSVRNAVERQNGQNAFTGERGEALLRMLAQEVLEEMLEERLVAQEARRLKIEIREERVEEEIRRISKEMYGDWEKFQHRLREDGISLADLQKHIRNVLLYKALREAKTPAGADPKVSFNTWLIGAKQKADLVMYEPANRGMAAASSGRGCCLPSGPSQGPVKGGSLEPNAENEAKKAALEAYQKGNPAEKGVSAQVTNYGCHLQVDIQKDGKIVKSYSYQGGRIFEMS